MKHLIVTRCNFKDDERFNKYFSAMKKYYIPSINSQTDKIISSAASDVKNAYDALDNYLFNRKLYY